MPQAIQPLLNKIALVTGAASGLGKQITKQLVSAGAKVAILGRTKDALNKLADELGSAVFPIQADTSNPDQIRHAFTAIDKHFGRLDILVNNAAVYEPFLIENATDEQLQRIISTNFLGIAYCMREAVKRMKPAGTGDIINVSSESARNPFPFLTVYAASKSAVESFSMGQRMELGGFGIRVMILRSGSMAGNDANASAANWTEAQLATAMASWERSGHIAFTGSGLEPATIATAAINALSLPREANTDIIEVRSTR